MLRSTERSGPETNRLDGIFLCFCKGAFNINSIAFISFTTNLFGGGLTSSATH